MPITAGPILFQVLGRATQAQQAKLLYAVFGALDT
jgi:hypothetical protein